MANQRKQQALETRQHLLEVGIPLIEARGYDNVKVEDITRACGVAVGTFYHHFKSKDAFFFAQNGVDFAAISAGVQKRSSTMALRENVRLFLEEWFAGIRALSPEYLAAWLGHSADSEYHEDVHGTGDTGRVHEQALEAGFRAYVEAGELRENAPVQEAAQFIVVTLYGLDVRYCMTQGVIDFGTWVPRIVGLFMAMMEPSLKKV